MSRSNLENPRFTERTSTNLGRSHRLPHVCTIMIYGKLGRYRLQETATFIYIIHRNQRPWILEKYKDITLKRGIANLGRSHRLPHVCTISINFHKPMSVQYIFSIAVFFLRWLIYIYIYIYYLYVYILALDFCKQISRFIHSRYSFFLYDYYPTLSSMLCFFCQDLLLKSPHIPPADSTCPSQASQPCTAPLCAARRRKHRAERKLYTAKNSWPWRGGMGLAMGVSEGKIRVF